MGYQQNKEDRENIYFYHEVFAKSLSVIQDLIRQGRKNDAKNIILFNYIYAKTLNGKDFDLNEVDDFKKKDIYECIHLMVKEQHKADLVPTQHGYRDSYFSRILSKSPAFQK